MNTALLLSLESIVGVVNPELPLCLEAGHSTSSDSWIVLSAKND